ncbi:MAG: hypothetical protein ACREN4_06265 [Candidatus Dormibacteria bacterium]
MAIIANLFQATGVGQRKMFAAEASVTSTAAIVTGLRAVDAGSAQATVQNSAVTIPTNIATVSGVVGGSVSVVVIALAAAGNTISAVAASVGLLCAGF